MYIYVGSIAIDLRNHTCAYYRFNELLFCLEITPQNICNCDVGKWYHDVCPIGSFYSRCSQRNRGTWQRGWRSWNGTTYHQEIHDLHTNQNPVAPVSKLEVRSFFKVKLLLIRGSLLQTLLFYSLSHTSDKKRYMP